MSLLQTAAHAGAQTEALGDISVGNVHQLQLAFSFRINDAGAESSAPAGAEGLLFVLGSFPHRLWAIDPSASPERRVRWHYAPTADRSAEGLSCCDHAGHGPVVAKGRVFFTTLDGRLVALDAATGALLFDVPVANPKEGETLAGAPLVAEGRVFVGNAGDDFGVRGWIAALDADSGKLFWKRYSTGPDLDVGIGPDFKPFYASLRGTDLGTSTWPPAAWQQGGGSVAGTLLYDKNTRALFHGTGHPAPWNAAQREGDNRWTSGVFARDAANGSARWFAGFNRHDPFVYRDAGSDVLMDAMWQGRERGLLVHPDANGMLYVVDRQSGQILAADPVAQSAVAGFDTANGETRYAPSKSVKVNQQTRHICPAWTGAFSSGASVLEGLVVLPVSRLCMDLEPRPANYIQGTPYTGANVRLLLDHADAGAVIGWNVAARKSSWESAEQWPVLGGTLTTESGLVFYGTLDGRVKALDGRNGKLLWQFKARAGIASRPGAFRGANGQPCISVVAGTGRLYGMSRVEALDPRDDTAGFGLAGLLRQLPQDDDTGSALLVFCLP